MRARRAWALAIVVAALPLVGCGSLAKLDFVKRRLPPPYAVEGGVLFQFSSPSARVVQVAGYRLVRGPDWAPCGARAAGTRPQPTAEAARWATRRMGRQAWIRAVDRPRRCGPGPRA